MRNFLLAFAVLLVVGAAAVAQTTYDQNQGTASPATTTSTQQNDSAMNQQTSGSADAEVQAAQAGVNSPDYRPDFRGTELEKAYQQEEQSGWQDPNITKSDSQNLSDGG
jgi:hypothetical protein